MAQGEMADVVISGEEGEQLEKFELPAAMVDGLEMLAARNGKTLSELLSELVMNEGARCGITLPA
jgi:hypothetical protein